MTETPSANRIHIAFFGLRNAGKSTLVNAFCGQHIAIVSEVPGTTTDPVSKAMEILPLGPCLITDTAGLDDVGELGTQRVAETLKVLETTDVAVWVHGADGSDGESEQYRRFRAACERYVIAVVEYSRGDDVESLKRKIAALPIETEPGVLDGVVASGSRLVLVCPIDESAPKGRLILPQVQVLRAALDARTTVTVCQPGELAAELESRLPDLVITDSQAFGKVSEIVAGRCALTSFSVLFARQKGDIEQFLAGVEAAKALKEGDRVLVAEACTHHRQCNDIGTTKIPAALARLSGKSLRFDFASGKDFPAELSEYALVVHCGGCMLTRRALLARLRRCREAKVPVVNYGLLLAAASGVLAKTFIPGKEK